MWRSITILVLFGFSTSTDTTCEDSQKHFANLCFTPNPFNQSKINDSSVDTQPADGWFAELGNDAGRLHISEAIRGELLTFNDNFENACVRVRVVHNQTTDIWGGTFSGYGKMNADCKCKNSADFPGVLLCEFLNPGATKYHESFNYYTSYTNSDNIVIGIQCYPNGQVGWIGFSVHQQYTDDEKKIVEDHIKSLGFSPENTVTMYDYQNCS